MKIKKEEVLQYLNIIGMDESLVQRNFENGVRIDAISSLYETIGAERILPSSSKNLSNIYEVLYSIINDNFFYETKRARESAYTNSLKIIDDLTSFQVANDFDPDVIFERTNNLITTIVSGLCSCGDINQFRIVEKNSSLESLIHFSNKCDLDIDTPKNLKILYLLIAYSRFIDIGRDHLIFDENNMVSYENLKLLINQNINEQVPLKNMENIVIDENLLSENKGLVDSPKKLTFERLTLRQLRNLK